MEVQRIQFEVPEGRVEEIEKLMKKAGIATKKELFNNALTLFEWAVRERERGHTIASVDEEAKRYRELMMPVFSNIRPVEKAVAAAA